MARTAPAKRRPYADDARWGDIDALVDYYKRTAPPRPGGTGAVYARGIDATVANRFRTYCRNRGYTIARALEVLMREAIEQDRLLRVK